MVPSQCSPCHLQAHNLYIRQSKTKHMNKRQVSTLLQIYSKGWVPEASPELSSQLRRNKGCGPALSGHEPTRLFCAKQLLSDSQFLCSPGCLLPLLVLLDDVYKEKNKNQQTKTVSGWCPLKQMSVQSVVPF